LRSVFVVVVEVCMVGFLRGGVIKFGVGNGGSNCALEQTLTAGAVVCNLIVGGPSVL